LKQYSKETTAAPIAKWIKPARAAADSIGICGIFIRDSGGTEEETGTVPGRNGV
jgi:hypothetical protein